MNGWALYPDELVNPGETLTHIQTFLKKVVGMSTAEVLGKEWGNYIYRCASETPLATLLSSKSCARAVLDDGLDLLVAVPLSVLLSSVVVRSFSFGGRTVAAETLGCPIRHFDDDGCDLMSRLDEIGAMIGETMGRKVVIMVAYQIETKRVAILDIRPLTPSIPFNRHLSWVEVCGAARVESVDKGSILRRQKMRVAQLEPYDELSGAWFPEINKLLDSGSLPLASDSSTSARAIVPVVSSNDSLHVGLLISAAAAALLMLVVVKIVR
jgi:hypothetical protein